MEADNNGFNSSNYYYYSPYFYPNHYYNNTQPPQQQQQLWDRYLQLHKLQQQQQGEVPEEKERLRLRSEKLQEIIIELVNQMTKAEEKEVRRPEFVEVNEAFDDPLYRNLLSASHDLYTFQRRSLYNSQNILTRMNIHQGRNNFMPLSFRMIRDFCQTLSNSKQTLASFGLRRVGKGHGKSSGTVLVSSTSLRLPVPSETLFNFLTDENRRHEWDVMYERSPTVKIGHICTGSHPGNSVSVIQPSILGKKNMSLLQESCIHHVGALVIFAPVDLSVVTAMSNGFMDMRSLPILPSGFLISSDGGPNGTGSDHGSVLTMLVQMLKMDVGEGPPTLETARTIVDPIITQTIQCIKDALDRKT